MTIDALPVAPNRLEPETFATRSDAFVSALVILVEQINAESLIMLGYSENANEKSGIATEQATKAERFAILFGEAVELGLYSSKEYAVGILTSSGGSAKSWATSVTSPDGTTSKSAKTLAAEALTSANNSADSAAAAAASLDTLEDQWLGPKATEPTVDNDGDPLTEGVLYYNTTNHVLRIFNGLMWQNALGNIEAEFTIFRQIITATAGQTVFPLFNRYEVGTNSIAIYKNGIRLLNTEYTETNDNTVTISAPAAAGDKYLFETGTTNTGTSVAATLVSLMPVVGLTATNVQEAILELSNTKVDKITIIGIDKGGTGATTARAAVSKLNTGRQMTVSSSTTLEVGVQYNLVAVGTYTVYLPNSPVIGDTVETLDPTKSWNNPNTITVQTTNVAHKINGTESVLVLNTNKVSYVCFTYAGTNSWIITI